MPETAETIWLAVTTAPDRDTAESLARALAGERLAACVTLLPEALSVFRWKGALTAEEEVLLLLKTSQERIGRLEERLAELHPYEVPEWLALPLARAGEAYAAWVAAETRE